MPHPQHSETFSTIHKWQNRKDKRITSFTWKPQSSTEMYTDRQMDTRKNTNCEPCSGPSQHGHTGQPQCLARGLLLRLLYKYRKLKVEGQLEQNRFFSALREGGAATCTALPIHGCWKGAISENPIISHTCILFTCSRQKPETHRLVLEERFKRFYFDQGTSQ